MKLYYDRKSKDPTYFMQQAYWDGSKSTSRNVRRIGKHSELLAEGIKDPKAYAQALIDQANKEIKESRAAEEITINFEDKVTAANDRESSLTSVNIGYFFLQAVINQLRLGQFFKKAGAGQKSTFDAYEVTRFMVYARILDPWSAKGTFDRREAYYESPDFQDQQILQSMDFLCENRDAYLEWLYRCSGKIVIRDSSVCRFYCFDTECEDPALRAGLLVDSQGIPVTMCIADGSESEQAHAIAQVPGCRKILYCADAGSDSISIQLSGSMDQPDFVITQSVRKLSDVLQQAVLDDSDYHLLSDWSSDSSRDLYDDLIFKILTSDSTADTGLTETIPSKDKLRQTVIITCPRKKMESLQNSQTDRLPEEGKYDGYQVSITSLQKEGNETDARFVKKILAINAERSRTEEYFRTVKNSFSSRPLLSPGKAGITARFLYCYTALLVYKLLELQLNNFGAERGPEPVLFTAEDIINTLKVIQVSDFGGMFYMAEYRGSQTLNALNLVFGLPLDRKYYMRRDLNQTIRKIL